LVERDRRRKGMKRKRYSEEQIIRVLKEKGAGVPVAELSRKYGVSEQTVYLWQRKFGGMEVSDAVKLRSLEKENGRLKKMVAELSLDKVILEDLLAKNF
jgi:putative transposase